MKKRNWLTSKVNPIGKNVFNWLGSLVILFLFTQNLEAQQGKVDSLETLLQNQATEDTTKVNLLNQLSFQYYGINPKYGLELGGKALVLAQRLNYGLGKANALRCIGVNEWALTNYDQALEAYDKALREFNLLQDSQGKAIIMTNIGLIYMDQGYNEKALENFLFALSFFEETLDKNKMAVVLGNIGIVYYNQGDNDKALEYYNRALGLHKELGMSEAVARQLGNIGNVYHDLGDNQQALNFHKQALKLDKALGIQSAVARHLGNIGNIYHDQGDIVSALDHHKQALELDKSLGRHSKIATHLGNLGTIYFDLENYDRALELYSEALTINREAGEKSAIASMMIHMGNIHDKQGDFKQAMDLYAQSQLVAEEIGSKRLMAAILEAMGVTYRNMGEYETALSHTKIALEMQMEMGEEIQIGQSYLTLAGIYQQMGKHDQAIYHGTRALEIAGKTGVVKLTKDVTEVLYKEMIATGRHKQAINYLQQHMVAKDSLFNSEKIKDLTRMTAEFDLKQKEAENEVLRLESEARESIIERQRIQIFRAVAILVLLLVFTGYMFRAWSIRRQLYTAIEKLNQAQSRWFTNIAHELRTPLTLITGPVHHFINQYQGRLDQKAMLDMQLIEKNGERLMRLVNDILDLSKLESGQLGVEHQVIDLSALARQAIYSFQTSFNDKNIKSEILLPESPVVVRSDSKKLETILINLVGNALKFTSDGGKVTLSISQEEERFCLKVADTGIGIKSEDLSKVFDRYYQVEQMEQGNTPTQGGSGIGLALSQELARLLGGELTAESEWGEGSNFILSLPISMAADIIPVASEIESPTSYEEVEVNSEEVNSEGHQILLVEDNADMRQYITNLLIPRYQVIEAVDGRAALIKLTGENGTSPLNPDLIISDIMMPRMDGLAFARELKNVRSQDRIPFVFLTARSDEEDKLVGLRIGVDDYITKPFKQAELLARIDNLIANASYRKRQDISEDEQQYVVEDTHELPMSFADELLDKLKTEVENRINDNQLSVDTLADAVGMHKKTLTRTLKKTAGLTPGKFIRDMRLHRALRFLEAKTYPTVNEVAYAVGFESPSNFAQAFRKRYGKKPTEYM